MQTENIGLALLCKAKRNSTIHSKAQIAQIAASIRTWGFTSPIIISDDFQILAGHGRAAAAALLGLDNVPCIRLSGMSEAQKRAYAIADNKIARNAGLDVEILALEMKELEGLGFDLEVMGFEQVELDMLFADAEASSPTKKRARADTAPALRPVTVTQIGDVWELGRHRLVCGDAADSSVLEALLVDELADMLFADSPYNVPIDGHASGLGNIRHREFAQACGELTPSQFTSWLVEALQPSVRGCRDGAIAFTCMDWRHIAEMRSAGATVFTELKNLCVWDKGTPGMGAFYRSQHELIFVWKIGKAAHINTFGLGEGGRNRSNIWKYPGMAGFGAGRLEDLARHPTPKPVAMVEDAIRDVTKRGQIVLDPFGGSGTTLIAANKCGRTARLVELDPGYCDVIADRFKAVTGKEAVLTATGETFEDVALARSLPVAKANGWTSNIRSNEGQE